MVEGKFIVNRLGLAISLALTAGLAQADYSSPFELSGLNGSNGFKLKGANEGDWAGASVSAAGDFNSDGIADLIIGAPNDSSVAPFAGTVYMLFGNELGFTNPLELSSIDSSSGMVISGINQFDSAGTSVAAAGDFNGDGFDDIVIGAATASSGGAYSGSTFVIFGSDQALPGSLDLSAIDGENGIAIHGESADDESGTSVDGAGDVNGDGIDDLIIGAPQAGNGAAYVIFGSNQELPHPLSLTDLDGSNGFKINAAGVGDSAGISVAGVKDFNGDGFEDILIGASLAGTVDAYAGAAYVVFGTDQGFVNPVNLSALDGVDGIEFKGVTQLDNTGQTVAPAGDFNGDGIDDIVIGAPSADPNGDASGAAYVVFGSDQSMIHPLNLSALDGSDGFVLNGANAGDNAGASVGPGGALNADDWDDLVVGANLASPNGDESGSAYVVFGGNQAWAASLELSDLDGQDGFSLNGVSAGDWTGIAVFSCGDVNHDSFTDLIVGAAKADSNGSNSGASYVVYGGGVGNSDVIFVDGFE